MNNPDPRCSLMLRGCTWIALLLLPMMAHATEAASQEEPPSIRWIALPFAAYDTDNGVLYGAHAEALLGERDPHTPPVRLSALLRGSSRGNWHGRIRHVQASGKRPGDTGHTLLLEWRHWDRANFFGIGNASPGVPESAIGPEGMSPAHHGLSHATLRLSARQVLAPHVSLYGAAGLSWSQVDVYPDSLLEEEDPFGIEGGFALEFTTGFLLDTTKSDSNPREGVRMEGGVRMAPPIPGGSGMWIGLLGRLAGYHALSQRVTLAGQVRVDRLWGEIPFYEMNCWGGQRIHWGFGGAMSLRGALFGRWIGPGKLIANAEVRTDVGSHEAFGALLEWQVVPFIDLGAVFGAESREPGTLLFAPVHPSAGLGTRLHIDKSFLLRLDVGVGVDGTRLPNGATRSQPWIGTYVVFGQLF